MKDIVTPQDFTRRDFIKGGSMATLMTLLGGMELKLQAAADTELSPPEAPKIRTRCAVIGLGGWGREIVSTLSRLPSAEIAAICDTYPAFLRRTARSAPEAEQVNDYRRILEDKDIAGVIVATPTHLHRDIVIEALQAGKHVYCEAPLAHTIDDARAIACAARDASKQHFQAGLQLRSDKHRLFVSNYMGARGRPVMAKAQSLRKQSWRQAAPTPEREAAMNWRLDPAISLGLIGETGINHVDAATWFHNARPVAVSGFGSIVHWRDGREMPDTSHVIVEYPGGVRLIHTSSLANSYEGDTEAYHGTDGTVMFIGSKAWLFKEADAPLLGWEVYARKDSFFQETGIALMLDATKQAAHTQDAAQAAADEKTPLYYALENFLQRTSDVKAATEDFTEIFGEDEEALAEHLETVPQQPAAGYREGYEATVTVIKAQEAVQTGQRIELRDEWFELG
jgi:predicted dehydrogenase